MRLASIRIDRTPGSDRTRSLDAPEADLVLIYGANESGKSSLVRVARQMLWGGNWAPVTAEACWTLGSQRFVCRLRDSLASWVDADGRPLDGSPVAVRASDAAWYLLGIEDLAAAGDAEHISRRAADLLSGGVNLARALKQTAPSRGTDRSEWRALREADHNVKRLQAGELALRQQERELTRLEAEQEQVAARLIDLHRIRSARDLAAARATAEAAQNRVLELPGGLEKLHDNELADFAELENEGVALRSRASQARTRLAELEAEPRALAEPLPAPVVARLQRYGGEIQQARARHADAVAASAAATAELESYAARLGSGHAVLADPEAAAVLADEAATLLDLELRTAAGHGGADGAMPATVPFARWLPLLLVALLAAGGAAVGAGGWWWAAPVAVILSSVPLARRRRATAAGSAGAGQEHGDLPARRERLAGALGEPPRDAAGMLVTARLVSSYAAKSASAEALRRAVEDSAATVARLEEALSELAAEHGLEEPSGDVLDRAEELLAGSESARSRQATLVGARDAVTTVDTQLEDWMRRYERTCERCGIPTGPEARAALTHRFQQRTLWQEATSQLEAARIRVAELEHSIAGDPSTIALADGSSVAQLDARLGEQPALEARRLELTQRCAEIRTALELAGDSDDLPRALAERQARKEALADARAELARHRIRARIVEWLASNAQDAVGAAGEAAAELLARMTAGKWRLVAMPAGEELVLGARGPDGAIRSLDELSTATRIQVLIAARLGFLETLEAGGHRLPVFVDEAFSNFDAQRRAAAAAAMARISSETGRQFVYLTADPDDLSRIKTAIEADASPASTRLATFSLDAATLDGHVPPPSSNRPPEPPDDDESLGEYLARTAAPPWDPWAPPGAAPAWLVCAGDAGTWHALHTARIETVGALRNLDQRRLLQPILPEGVTPAHLMALASALETVHAVWRRGRAPRLDPADLREIMRSAGINLSRWGEPFEAVLDDTATGTGTELLSELRPPSGDRDDRLKGLKAPIVERFEEALQAAGQLPSGPEGSLAEALSAAITSMPDISRELVEWWWDLACHSSLPIANR